MNHKIFIFLLLSPTLFASIDLGFPNRQELFNNEQDALIELRNKNIPPEVQNEILPDGVHFLDDDPNEQVNIIDNDVPVINDNEQIDTTTLQTITAQLSNIDTDDDVPTLELILNELKILNGEDPQGDNQLPDAENNENTNDFVTEADTGDLFPDSSPLSSIIQNTDAPIFEIGIPSISEGGSSTKTLNLTENRFSNFLSVGKTLLTAYVVWGIFSRTWQAATYLISV